MPNPSNTYPGPTPYLSCKDAAQALEFYQRALGARVVERFDMPDGRIGHAELGVGAGSFMLADEFPDIGFRSPATLGGSPVILHIAFEDLAAAVTRAREAGARVLRETKDEHGERCTLQDPFGHVWSFSSR